MLAPKAPPKPAPTEDDWLNDLGDVEDSPGQLPPIVKKKKQKTASTDTGNRKRSKESRELPLIVHYLMMAGTGLIGGLIGAAIWAGLIYYTNLEIGYVAVLVGFLSGVGKVLRPQASGTTDGDPDWLVAVAIMGLIVGKVVGFQLVIQRELGNQQAADVQGLHENIFIAGLAEGIKAATPNAAGAPNLNADDDTFDPEKLPQQYPPEIWNEAKAQWAAVPEAQKQEMQKEGIKLVKPNLSLLFGPYDLLWSFLAIGAAFRAATGGQDD